MVWVIFVVDFVLIIGFFWCIIYIWYYFKDHKEFRINYRSMLLKGILGLASLAAKSIEMKKQYSVEIINYSKLSNLQTYEMYLENTIDYINICLAIYMISYTGSFVFIAVFYWMTLVTAPRPTEEYQKEECHFKSVLRG